MSGAGVLLDPAGFPVARTSGIKRSPRVASNGVDYLVVWQDERGATPDIYGARVSGAGVALDPTGIAIANAAGRQLVPVVASNGVDYLVAWQDFRSGTTSDIHGARVSSAGAVLDPGGRVISAVTNSEQTPSVASRGADYLVTWLDFRSGRTAIYASSPGPKTEADWGPTCMECA